MNTQFKPWPQPTWWSVLIAFGTTYRLGLGYFDCFWILLLLAISTFPLALLLALPSYYRKEIKSFFTGNREQ